MRDIAFHFSSPARTLKKLEEGGTVVGLFEEAEYESVTVQAASRKRVRDI